MSSPIDAWLAIVRSKDVKALEGLLADEVVFFSPVVHTPQAGKEKTLGYLSAALTVLDNPSFRYTRKILGERDALLEFETVIDSIIVNGVDLITWNAEGKIIEFKVMVRPLKAIQAVQAKMLAQLTRMGRM